MLKEILQEASTELNPKDQLVVINGLKKYQNLSDEDTEALAVQAGLLDNIKQWRADGGWTSTKSTSLASDETGLYINVDITYGDEVNSGTGETTLIVRANKGKLYIPKQY